MANGEWESPPPRPPFVSPSPFRIPNSSFSIRPMRYVLRSLTLPLLLLFVLAPGCGSDPAGPDKPDPIPVPAPTLAVNFAHLDALGEAVTVGGVGYRIVHIYADAPSYAWVTDDDEGAACLDDAARAAVVYLRDFELNGTAASRAKAEALLRFVAYMQTDRGTFYNFVWDNTLRINTVHVNSKADRFEWWAARGVWALAEGARVLKTADPAGSQQYAERVRRSLPHLRSFLDKYGQTTSVNGRSFPRWMVNETAFDATSELLLGLVALQRAYPDAEIAGMIAKFSEGLEAARFGTLTAFPYGAHAAWPGGTHPWGNAQTMALARAGRPASAKAEADTYYAKWLVDGPWHHLDFTTSTTVPYEQIAYDIRTVAVGYADLFAATGERRYAVLAGVAAAWLTGHNAPAKAMYDAATGRGYDGINGPAQVNINSGAESTIEALMTVQEVTRHAEARPWIFARGAAPVDKQFEGGRVRYRVFTAGEGASAVRGALVLRLDAGTSDWLEGDALTRLLAG